MLAMRTFAELLCEYTSRTGVSDAELARAIGVQRQTIFRWKEGLVARPRSAEDVLRLAGKLRLLPAERDALLMAAGFPPVNPPSADLSPASLLPAESGAIPVRTPPLVITTPRRRVQPAGIVVVGSVFFLIALVAAAFWLVRRAAYPRAKAGETLIIIGQFANYTGGAQGYNVAGRVREALERELAADRLAGVRTAEWPAVIADGAGAEAATRRAGAALTIWGEYDSGRVVARLTTAAAAPDTQHLVKLAASSDALSATINGTLPEEVRYLALLTIGQVYVDRGDYAQARAVLVQAAARPPAEPSALASLHFLLGYTYQVGRPSDLDQAIVAYTAALAAQPELAAAYNNRGIAYLRRRQPGDPARSIADLTRFLAAFPDEATAYVNRGAAYLLLGGAQNTRLALADLDRAIVLDPDLPEAYFNRGLAHVRLNQAAQWQADFQQTLTLDAGHAAALSGLCWGYALAQAPETALSYCDQAVASEPSGAARDSRGIVYAQLGRYAEAIADFEAYLAAQHNGGATLPSQAAARYRTWLDALRAGRNPFDRDTLDQLRQE